MTLKEAITHCEEVAERYETQEDCKECAADHRQLKEWLQELQERRKESKWISVEKEMPPLEVNSRDYTITVLVLMIDGSYNVCYYCYDDEGNYWTTEDEKKEFEDEQVTHWQPLPVKPPQDDDGKDYKSSSDLRPCRPKSW